MKETVRLHVFKNRNGHATRKGQLGDLNMVRMEGGEGAGDEKEETVSREG